MKVTKFGQSTKGSTKTVQIVLECPKSELGSLGVAQLTDMQGESVDVSILRTYPDMFDNTSKLNKDKDPELPGMDDTDEEEEAATNPALVMHKELGLVLLVGRNLEDPQKVMVDPGNEDGPSCHEVLLSDLYTNDESKIPLDQFESEIIDDWISNASRVEVVDSDEDDQEETASEEELSELEQQILDILKPDEFTTSQQVFEQLPDAGRDGVNETLESLRERGLVEWRIGGFWKMLSTTEEDQPELKKQLLAILKVDEYAPVQVIYEQLPKVNREEIAHTLNDLKNEGLAESKVGGLWKRLPVPESTETAAESATADADYDPFEDKKQDDEHWSCNMCQRPAPDNGCSAPKDGSKCPNYVPPAEVK